MVKTYSVLLDTMDTVTNPAFTINTNDLKTIQLNILINQDKEALDLTGATVRLAIKKPDRTTVMQDCTIVDPLAGSCEIVLDTQAYVIAGDYAAEVMVYFTADTVAVTSNFTYTAKKGILDDGTVESTNEFQSINQLISDAQTAATNAETSATAAATSEANAAQTAQEALQARTPATGTAFATLKARLDDSDTHLANMTTLITPSMSQTTIQNAINNSATKKIKFMSGSYNLSSLTLSNVSVEGEGSDNTTLTTSFSIGSNVTFSNIKLSSTNSVPILQNNTSNVWFNRCYITGNGIYLNDLSANNIHFKDCELAFCTGTAINIVDKCTLAKHIQDIYVENCYFHDNTNGNIGCISRQDGTNPVVSGYQNINLLNCRFIKEVNVQSDMEINVSFDSFVSSPKNLSGNITVRGCTFINGFYGFECAGGTDLIFEHNTIIQNSTVGARILSMSNLSSTYSNAIIRNNTFNGVGGVYVVGNNNIFEHNNINTSGVGLVIGTGDSVTCRHNDVVVTNGNSIIVSIATNMLVENNYLNNSATSGNNAIVISNCNGSIVSIVNNIINTLAVPIQITGSTSEIVQSGNKNAKGYDMPSYYQGNTNNGSIKKVQKYSSSNFFTVTNNNATIQSNMLMKVTYSSRNNNNPVGGFFTVAFNTFSSANVLPFVTNGTNITVTVGSTSPYVFTFTLTSVVNDSVLFDIEMVTLKTGDWVIN